MNNFKQTLSKLRPYILILLGFFATLMILILLIDLWILPAFIHSGEQVKVPYLINKKIEDAKIIIDNANLDIERISEQYSETFPKGCVMNQIPKPGAIVKEGRNMYLTVSKGMETVKVPFLIGQSLFTARRTLQRCGLVMGDVQYNFSEGYGADTVIVQNTEANTNVIYGAAVNVIVSKGSEIQISIPNLIGLSYSEALSSIIESDLIIGSIDSVSSDTYLPNTVIKQFPVSGELAGKNSLINITVTK